MVFGCCQLLRKSVFVLMTLLFVGCSEELPFRVEKVRALLIETAHGPRYEVKLYVSGGFNGRDIGCSPTKKQFYWSRSTVLVDGSRKAEFAVMTNAEVCAWFFALPVLFP